MKTYGKRALSLLLAAALLLALGAASASAKSSEYPSVRVYADGLLTGRAYRYGEEVYLSVGDVCRYLGMDAAENYERSDYSLSVTAPGLTLEAQVGRMYVHVNGRWLLNPRGILVTEDRAYFPIDMIEKIFNLRTELSPEKDRLELNLREAVLLPGGESWYEDQFGRDNLLWLSRLIEAEASDQPFAGRVAVGNVVLNRVASDQFPNTIFDVIFDTQNGVQFAPVYTGAIYKDAGQLSVIAACICLEGYRMAGDSLFFVAPAQTDDSWLREHYVYVTSIGQHDFYM
ncbi:MAG: cell wall hydrolase [Clostridia bacterium]